MIAATTATTTPVVAEFFGVFKPDPYWDERLIRAPLDKLNRLIVAFAPIVLRKDNQYSIDFQEPASNEERVKKLLGRVRLINPTAQLHLSVGASQNNPLSFQDAAKDPNFALNAKIFMEKFGFTGLDFDWENYIQHDMVSLLATRVRQEFRSSGYLMTMDGGSSVSGQMYDMQKLKECLSFNAMTYGPYCDFQDGIQSYTDAGFPIGQINIGIESEYQNQFGMDTPGPNGSIVKKGTYALQNGMEGGFEWREENDDCDKKPNWPTFQCQLQLWSTMTGEELPRDKDGNFIEMTYEERHKKT